MFKRISNEVTYLRAALRSLKQVSAIYDNPTRTLADVVEQHAVERPNNIAIMSEAGEMTYGELNAAANRYARWAREQGVGPEVSVALLMENRAE